MILLDMLSYKRPNGSQAEDDFIHRYLLTIPGAWRDGWGNVWVHVGSGKVLWACHTDTMHYYSGYQQVDVQGDYAMAKASDCLGADDTAGVYLMVHMISNKVPGYYVFHRGEEFGCIGSRAVAAYYKAKGGQTPFSAVISLDRHGKHDIITHQMDRRTCSEAFAWRLADAIGMGYAPCPHGVYTDSYSYHELVPECTNISVGFDREHSAFETLDMSHLIKLLARLLSLKRNIDDLACPGGAHAQ